MAGSIIVVLDKASLRANAFLTQRPLSGRVFAVSRRSVPLLHKTFSSFLDAGLWTWQIHGFLRQKTLQGLKGVTFEYFMTYARCEGRETVDWERGVEVNQDASLYGPFLLCNNGNCTRLQKQEHDQRESRFINGWNEELFFSIGVSWRKERPAALGATLLHGIFK